MIPISLKLEEEILKEAESLSKSLETSRNKYINIALEYYNKKVKREILSKQMAEASLICRKESMNVLNDFEKFDDTQY
ncbi:MAG TPA: hypothetical protein VD908_17990 [Cytophagales bacterium]|nr:hypothetical protein [Cytophagales bacterium]